MATHSPVTEQCKSHARYDGGMRILVVSTWYPTRDAPFRTPFITRHVRAIARDHEVHVIHVQLLNDSPVTQETYDGVAVTRVGFDPRKPLTMIKTLVEIRKWARSADVVHTMAFSSALVAAPVVRRTPWVHTEHWNGVPFPETISTAWQVFSWSRHVLRLPTLVSGVSSLMNEALSPFSRPDRVRKLGNVVDYAPDIQPRPGGGRIRLIAVGSLIERKNPILTVETLAWLRSQGHDATLTWDGSGPLLASARQRAAELGVENFIQFRGHRTGDQLWDDLAEANVFVLLSSTETFCVAAAEALAAGRPVVMRDVGGQTDFIRRDNGRMVHQALPDVVGHAILDVLNDQGLSAPEEMSRGIRKKYGSEDVSGQLTGLYREALGLA